MGAANRREAARTRGVSSISTVVSSLPSLGAGVRNYVHHVRFVPKQDSRTSPRGVPGIPRVTRSSPRRDASPSRRSLARSRRRAVPRVHGSIPRAADLPSFRRPVRRFASWSVPFPGPGSWSRERETSRRFLFYAFSFARPRREKPARRLTSPSPLLCSSRPPSFIFYLRVRSRR